MNNSLKYSMIFGSGLVSFIFGITNPVMAIYFTSRVDPSIISLANMITLGLGGLIKNSVNIDKIMNLYRKYFIYIILLDLLASAIIYAFSIDHINFRYIGLAISNATTANLWLIVINNAINRNINGDALTKFNASMGAYDMYASMFGSLTALILTNNNISINNCLILQWFALFIMGIIDIRAYKRLTKNIE